MTTKIEKELERAKDLIKFHESERKTYAKKINLLEGEIEDNYNLNSVVVQLNKIDTTLIWMAWFIGFYVFARIWGWI